MKISSVFSRRRSGALLGLALLAALGAAEAKVEGITGVPGGGGGGCDRLFYLNADQDHIATPDGGSVLIWAYGDANNPSVPIQYPGPTLIANQGERVCITLFNALPEPVSMVFPGQTGVQAFFGREGILTNEAEPGAGTVQYEFVASQPGTFTYHSGTHQDVQVELGLFGALIVRPTGYNATTNKRAYASNDSRYDVEYLFLLSEMDVNVHAQIDALINNGVAVDAATGLYNIDTSQYHPVWWFINGRNGPDTMGVSHDPLMPLQPYNALVRMNPGQKVLARIIGGGRESHPFHTHGNNTLLIAKDGRTLSSQGPNGASLDLAISNFTTRAVPGATYDELFEWTGKGMGWDIYTNAAGQQHVAADPLETGECPAARALMANQGLTQAAAIAADPDCDHGKPIPVLLPNNLDQVVGGFYSGSPFLGVAGALPVGEGGLNPNSGYVFMWHSHTERELVNFDIFPGGMMTMLVVEPASVPVTE